MITIDFFIKNKSKIVNAGIILLALILSAYLYNKQSQQLDSLRKNKDEEVKKNEVLESLNRVERRINGYKQVLNRKDLGAVIGAMTDIAKEARIQLISVKPGTEQQYADYVKTYLLIVVKVSDYHALGQFISKVENYKDLFFVEDVNILSAGSNLAGKKSETNLDISLKMSTITCL